MKRISYILLILIVLLQSGGLVLIFHFQQLGIQIKMGIELEKENTKFEKLTLSFRDFEKSKTGSNEILLNGKMYDIKSVCIKGNSVEILAINDSDEESVLQKIKYFTKHNNKSESKFPEKLLQLLSFTYISPGFEKHVNISSFQKMNFPSFDESPVSGLFEIATPPPRLV